MLIYIGLIKQSENTNDIQIINTGKTFAIWKTMHSHVLEIKQNIGPVLLPLVAKPFCLASRNVCNVVRQYLGQFAPPGGQTTLPGVPQFMQTTLSHSSF